MKLYHLPVTVLGSFASLLSALAGEIPVKPKIESVGLFKNGIAIISASFPAKDAGDYRWDDVPRAVHGTFWIESTARVTTQTTTRMIERTEAHETSSGFLQADLQGKEVTLSLKAGNAPAAVSGRVWSLPAPLPAEQSWDRAYQSTDPFSYYYGGNQKGRSTAPAASSTGGFLVLDRGDTRQYIDLASIASLEVTGPFGAKTVREERPVLIFHVTEPDAASGMVRVSWLTKGMAWVPSYQVDLTDPASLTLRQNALVRNELMGLNDTAVGVISGFPSIQFSHVDSPMWPGAPLAGFFAQASRQGGGGRANMMTQQAIYSNSARFSEAAPVPDVKESGGSSGDIHYQDIGRHTLAAGDTISVDVATASAKYERVVEWKMADTRDEWGRQRQADYNAPPDDDTAVWDAVQFPNPFKFPMTTGSAIFNEAGTFRGQSMANWTSPGQLACMRITKALSVTAVNRENEVEGAREEVAYMGRSYRKTQVKGALEIRNQRATPVTMVARMEYSGEFLSAEENPVKTLLPAGVFSVNARRELQWKFQVASGEAKTVNYAYSVLVPN